MVVHNDHRSHNQRRSYDQASQGDPNAKAARGRTAAAPQRQVR